MVGKKEFIHRSIPWRYITSPSPLRKEFNIIILPPSRRDGPHPLLRHVDAILGKMPITLWADWAVNGIGGASHLLRIILCLLNPHKTSLHATWTLCSWANCASSGTVKEGAKWHLGQHCYLFIKKLLCNTCSICKCPPSTPVSILNSFQRIHLTVFCPDFLVSYSSNFSLLTPQTTTQPLATIPKSA